MHATTEAYRLANKLMLARLDTKLSHDPGANLSQFLLRQASSYDQVVAKLVPVKVIEPSGFAEKTDEAPKRPQLISGTVEVVQPLDGRIVNIALGNNDLSECASVSGLSEELIEGLNSAILKGEPLSEPPSTRIISIGPKEVVKISASADIDEIDNLQYLNTLSLDFAVPECLGVLRSGRRSFFFMSRIPGQTLETLWPSFTHDEKTSIQRQLSALCSDLRCKPLSSAQRPQKTLGGFSSGICRDIRRVDRQSDGAIESEQAFNEFLCQQPGRTRTPWIRMVQSFLQSNHRIVPTHGDLHPGNIMIVLAEDAQQSPRISGILDWEASGWYPEYWEYVKALNTLDLRGPLADWCDYLPTDAIGSWPVEYSLDLLISRWLG